MKPIYISALMLICIAFGVAFVPVCEQLQDRFLPSGAGLVSHDAGPVLIMSTIELQRELNKRYPDLKLEEDGIYGPLTEAAHVRAIGDQYAAELMVREIAE